MNIPQKLLTMGALNGKRKSPLLDGLISCWKMDEFSDGSVQVPRMDSFGTNHLTDNNKAPSAAGYRDLAVVISSTKFLYCLSNETLQTGDIEFTVAARVYPTALGGSYVIAAKGESSNTAEIEWGLVISGASPRVSLNAWNAGVQIITANTFGNLSINTWYDVIAWVDKADNKYYIEVNGVSDSATRTKIIAPHDSIFGVGAYGNGGVPLSGRIDDVCFWKRKLTADERQDWRENGISVSNSDSFVGSYSLTELTVGGQSAEYLVPPSQSGTLVLYHHGSGEAQAAWRVDTLKPDLRESLLGAGHILAASAARGNNWGNQLSVDDYVALYNDAVSRFSVSKVIFLSQSMGGISGLLAVVDGRVPVDGWLGIFPACNLANNYANIGFTDAIKSAYGIAADGSDYAAKTAGHDPVLLSGNLFTGLPMRFYASASDTTVTKADNTDAMAALVSGYAAESDVVVCTGGHGDGSHFQPSDVLSFISRC